MLWSSRIKDWSSAMKDRSWSIRNDGTVEICVGLSLSTIVVVEIVLRYQQDRNHQELLNLLRTEARSSEDLQEKEIWNKIPTLFECFVRKQPLNLDGNKCLTGVAIGDKVQVLQEKVGPDEMYNLCRSVDDEGEAIAVGWFPTQCLEKVK
jgi:hypothetical protein